MLIELYQDIANADCDTARSLNPPLGYLLFTLCVEGVGMPPCTCGGQRTGDRGLVPSFQHTAIRNPTQAIRLEGEGLFPQDCLGRSQPLFIKKYILVVLGVEAGALTMLDMYSNTEFSPQPEFNSFFPFPCAGAGALSLLHARIKLQPSPS